MSNILDIVVPCYNEEEIFPLTSSKLNEVLLDLISKKMISEKSRITFVDDGSKDNTWNLISDLVENNSHFKGVKLTRNRGQQHALLAGLEEAAKDADMIITLDADLQDDISVIGEMVKQYENGYDIIYGVRKSRKKDRLFKKMPALLFYKLMKKMKIDLVSNHAHFRLMSNRAVKNLLAYKEKVLFLRGTIPEIGYKSTIVTYDRLERAAGESKYPLKKLINLAWDCIASYSEQPINIIFNLGLILFIIGTGFNIFFLVDFFVRSFSTPYLNLIILTAVWTGVGLIMVSIGVIGKYIYRIMIETKQRPLYFIEQIKEHKDK